MEKFNEKKYIKKRYKKNIIYVLNALNIHKTYYNIHAKNIHAKNEIIWVLDVQMTRLKQNVLITQIGRNFEINHSCGRKQNGQYLFDLII